jgi:hypothetical protein
MLRLIGLLALVSACSANAAQPLRVGPQREFKTIAEAAEQAGDGSTIEVDAGTYRGDVAVWARDRVTLRAVGGRVRLVAAGRAAEEKAIWVVRARGMRVEGFDFEGTRVPGRNGAGIRFERGSLLVRDCRFIDNEMGLLAGNDADAVLEVENSEFAHNRRDDGGHNHNLYAGAIARLSVTGSYFHDATVGHLLKSRAAVSEIRYNRLTDEGGRASYELEFPNGGRAIVVGNLIQQSERTENSAMLSYGAEGYRWPLNELTLVHNTFIDDLPSGGVFVRTFPGAVQMTALNNLWVGNGKLPAPIGGGGDQTLGRAELDSDFRPRAGWHALGVSTPPQFTPHLEYRHPRATTPLAGQARFPGALQPARQ